MWLEAGPDTPVGLIGFGWPARKYYVLALHALDGVSLAAVVDPLNASREAAGAAFRGCQAVRSGRAIAMAARRIDCSLAALNPPGLVEHRCPARASRFSSRSHSRCGESSGRPPTRSTAAAAHVDLNRRFWPPYRRIRDSVGAGLLGELDRVEFGRHVDVRPWCSVTSHPLQAAEGGALYNLGSQAIDLVRWLTGMEPRKVSATSESRR